MESSKQLDNCVWKMAGEWPGTWTGVGAASAHRWQGGGSSFQGGRLALEEGEGLAWLGGLLQDVILGVFPPSPSLKYLHPVPVYP